MKVLELHFNTKAREDVIFDSFCFEPENLFEKVLGNLYIVGELNNAMPQSAKFLENLAGTIKKEYYGKLQSTPEQCIKDSLKKANEFLEAEAKRGNVNWLGNLNIAAISVPNITRTHNSWEVLFTKANDIKIILARGNQIIDVGKDLENQGSGLYPMRIFGNIVSGKVIANDKILILTKELFGSLVKAKLVEKLASAPGEKEIQNILKANKETLSPASGICLLMIVTQPSGKKETVQNITLKKEKKKLTLKELLLNPVIFIAGKSKFILSKLGAISDIKKPILPSFNLRLPAFTLKTKGPEVHPVASVKKIKKYLLKSFRNLRFRKNLVIVLALIFLLIGGYFGFKEERNAKRENSLRILSETRQLISQAESFISFRKDEKASELLLDAWNKILPETKLNSAYREKALVLKSTIEEELLLLNKSETIENPELFYEIKSQVSIPQRIMANGEFVFTFNSASPDILKINADGKSEEIITLKNDVKAGTMLDKKAWFFSNTNKIFLYYNNELKEYTLELPSPGYSLNEISSYKTSIYFLNKRSGEVLRYEIKENESVFKANFWLAQRATKAIDAKSFSVDGNVWILAKNNEINRYYAGYFQDTLSLKIWPTLSNPARIWASPVSANIYLLEPDKKRLVIVDDTGKTIKQYQSAKFNNLRDFAVSSDEKTIWILNAFNIYRIDI